MPVVWGVVLTAAVIGLGAAFVGVGGHATRLEGAGLLFVLPLGTVGVVAVRGMQGRWTRGLAVLGLVASIVALAAAGMLMAAIAVGQGIGEGLGAIAGVRASTPPRIPIEVTLGFTVVAALGCAFGVIAGPPRPFAGLAALAAPGAGAPASPGIDDAAEEQRGAGGPVADQHVERAIDDHG